MTISKRFAIMAIISFATALSLSGCDSKPQVAPEKTTATSTGATADGKDQGDRALLNAIEAPQNKARAVEAQVLDAAKKQQEQIDAASGD